MKQKFKFKIIFIFFVSALLLGYTFRLADKAINQYILQSNELFVKYEKYILWLHVDQRLKIAELNQLNYVITGKDKYLELYEMYRDEVIRDMAAINSDFGPRDNVDLYKSTILRKIEFMNESVQQRSAGQVEAIQVLLRGEGHRLSDELNTMYNFVVKQARVSLDEMTEKSKLRAVETRDLLYGTSLISFALLFISILYILFDISKQQRFERALIQAEAAAVRSSHFKSQFLSHMSHEIRTPLNSIIAMGELLSESPLDDEQKNFVNTFKRSGDSLLRIVDEVLDLSKIEAGAMTLEEIEFCLENLLSDIRNLSIARTMQKGISFKVDNRLPARPCGIGDPMRLQQVLLNLISNAIKFTAKGGVTLIVEPVGGKYIRFSVQDTGAGIAKENLAKLFTPFQQAEISTARVFGGTGLGLTISKQIVGLMGGQIEVTSELGHGSCFYFTVPIFAENRVVTSKAEGLQSEVMPMAQPLTLPQLNLHKILVVDDVPENRNLIFLYLKNFGCKFEFAESGTEAITKFKEAKFDVVLMDVQMPGMDGHKATKIIRQYEVETGVVRTPIIALTAQAFAEEKEKAKKAGCDMHVTKPIKKQILIDAIVKVMAPAKVA